MDIKIPGVFARGPGHSRIPTFHIIGELPDELTDLNNAHAAGILKQQIRLKGRIAVLVSHQIIRNAITIHDNLSKQDLITLLDKAAPPLLRCSLKMLCRWTRL